MLCNMIRTIREQIKEGICRSAFHSKVEEWYRSHRSEGIRILTYHSFGNDAKRDLFMKLPIAMFARQLDFLSTNYRVVPLSLAADLITGRTTDKDYDPRPIAVITIDDGFEECYSLAFPELSKRSLPATIFVATDFVDTGRLPWPTEISGILSALQYFRPITGTQVELKSLWNKDSIRRRELNILSRLTPSERMLALQKLRRINLDDTDSGNRPCALSWAQIEEMAKEGIEIGSHTAFHSILPYMPREIIQQELRESKHRIEKMLNRPCQFFAYPNGTWNLLVAQEVEAAGYEAAVSQDWGLNDHIGSLYALNRIEIPYYESLEVFACRVSGLARPVKELFSKDGTSSPAQVAR